MISDQLLSGQWNTYVNDPEWQRRQSDAFIQIGHGAPGIIVGVLAIRPVNDELRDNERNVRASMRRLPKFKMSFGNEGFSPRRPVYNMERLETRSSFKI